MTSEELKFFDNIASKWDSMEHRSTPAKINEILDIVGVGEGWDVLDLGTGTGVLVPYLSERVGPKGSVLGIDLSDGMLREARRKYGNLGNVMFEKRDFEASPLPGRYDLIMMYCVYPHLQRPYETLGRLVEDNLKPGGRIIIGFPSDEKFINSIHAEKKVDHDHLPQADILTLRFAVNCLHSRKIVADEGKYLVEVYPEDECVREVTKRIASEIIPEQSRCEVKVS